ncbi:uncharacterized protein DUF3291 [Roseibium hamelinense]|uniref:Uncharacterized protein DUF3291 n=1 Tax=Roseibium hamelinense TaxID=150831 RepID=A0A562TK15_9HYPH|nr:DUF3291 domain-containing protein [Roseibium hamelinense]MTI45600.1 DUF3291 domain-containing protein [Roseibium hamelinense]TWI93220.1 uncharacterized protein DUF3291 [Roseibium hamelinense]
MPDFRLAAYTFNQFVAPYQSDTIKGFRDAEPQVFQTLEKASGFLARSGYEGEDGPASWGTQVFPACWENTNGDGWAPSTLSLWSSIEALMAAVYHGPHGSVLRHGRDWHIRADHIPEYVLWWAPDGHTPDWAEAVRRFESLMEKGPQPEAFSFKSPFDADGRAYKPDIARVKTLAQTNAKTLRPV